MSNPNPMSVVEALAAFIAWNTKYPSSRIYSVSSIRKIAAELDTIAEQAKEALPLARSMVEKLKENNKELARLHFYVKYHEWPPAGLPESEWEQHHKDWPSAASEQKEKLERYDELVAGMTWFADRLNRWGWKNHVSYVAIIQAHDCPAVIKTMLSERK